MVVIFRKKWEKKEKLGRLIGQKKVGKYGKNLTKFWNFEVRHSRIGSPFAEKQFRKLGKVWEIGWSGKVFLSNSLT